MDDLISRKAVLALPRNKVLSLRTYEVIGETINVTDIEHLPPAQPERKKGRWIVKEKGCKLTSYKCSECGRYIADDTGYDVKEDYPFCHCGADMREDADE